MTTKKNISKKGENVVAPRAKTARPMTTKVKPRPKSPELRTTAKTDRANQALKTLVKSMKKKEDRQ